MSGNYQLEVIISDDRLDSQTRKPIANCNITFRNSLEQPQPSELKYIEPPSYLHRLHRAANHRFLFDFPVRPVLPKAEPEPFPNLGIRVPAEQRLPPVPRPGSVHAAEILDKLDLHPNNPIFPDNKYLPP